MTSERRWYTVTIVPYGASADQANRAGPERFSTSGPGMDTQASLDDGGRIDLWMDLKSKLKRQELDLPQDYAVPVKEFAVDKTATDYPILNIVIFLVGSRGQSPLLPSKGSYPVADLRHR